MTVEIRNCVIQDAAVFAEIYAPYVTDSWISFEEEPPRESDIARRIDLTMQSYPWLTAVLEGEIVGYAYGGRFRERAAYRYATETTIYLRQDSHRQGIGRALYTALLEELGRRGFTQAVALIALPNEASVGLHERLGFYPAGINREVGYKMDQWIDVGLWQRPIA